MRYQLLTRDAFRDGVFQRDDYRCVICRKPAVDAHHIIDRRLWRDGGYYLANGVAVCQDHHLDAEMTVISVESLREAAGIRNIVVPAHLYGDQSYDKWANPVLANGQRLKGELFFDPSVQKILAAGRVLDLFSDRVKYPRTHHVPWSDGMQMTGLSIPWRRIKVVAALSPSRWTARIPASIRPSCMQGQSTAGIMLVATG